jgi:hypothetical protein
MENYDAEGMMEQHMGVMGDTMGQMEQDAAEDYQRSFEPEAPSESAYQPPQQPYGGEYDEYLDQAGEMEPQQQQMPQLPFKDLAQMASAIADSLVTDDGANYVGPSMVKFAQRYVKSHRVFFNSR